MGHRGDDALPLPTPTRSAQRYLGDAKAKVVHDLLNEQPECDALGIIAQGNGERFVPDKVQFALSIGYRACPHCLPEYAEEPAAASGGDEAPAEPAGPAQG